MPLPTSRQGAWLYNLRIARQIRRGEKGGPSRPGLQPLNCVPQLQPRATRGLQPPLRKAVHVRTAQQPPAGADAGQARHQPRPWQWGPKTASAAIVHLLRKIGACRWECWQGVGPRARFQAHLFFFLVRRQPRTLSRLISLATPIAFCAELAIIECERFGLSVPECFMTRCDSHVQWKFYAPSPEFTWMSCPLAWTTL